MGLWSVVAVATLLCTTGRTQAGLVLTINNYTTDELSITISGTFDANTVGESEGYLALKNNWLGNVGFHTELFSFEPTVILNTIQIGGIAPTTHVQDFNATWTDNVYFENPLGTETPILAGTTVTGTLTLSGVGAFDPSNAATLQLVSGFNRPQNHDDWARFEASANVNTNVVPAPPALLLLGTGVLPLTIFGWRRSRKGQPAAA
jgi:hypothetical protein